MLLLALMSVTGFTSCNKEDQKMDAVVAILKNSGVDYWQQIAKAITEECGRQGVKPIITFNNENADVQGQLAHVAELDELKKNYDIKGIILGPVFTQSDHRVEQGVADFAGRDIPVVIIDTPLDEQNSPLKDTYHAFVGTDNKTAGRQMAQQCGISDPSTLLICKVVSSVPADERYKGFCEEMQQNVPAWSVDDVDTPENLRAELAKHPGVKNLVFFNGSLCNSVTEAFDGLDVYTFDAYAAFLKDLQNPQTAAIKGVMLQNTFQMGEQAVKAIFSPVTEKNIYIPAIYLTSSNLNAPEVKPFMTYYNL